MTQNLLLVGSVHIDVQGPIRLEYLLQTQKPDSIAIEASEERIPAYLGEIKNDDLEKETIDMITNTLQLSPEQRRIFIDGSKRISRVMGYEFRVPSEYKKENTSTEIHLIDKPTGLDARTFHSAYTAVLQLVLKQQLTTQQGRETIMSRLTNGNEGFMEFFQGFVKDKYNHTISFEKACQRFASSGRELFQQFASKDVVEFMSIVHDLERNDYMEKNIRSLYNPEKKLLAVMGIDHLSDMKRRLEDLNPRSLGLHQYMQF